MDTCNKICDYGCGQKALFQLKNGKWCCSDNYCKCPEMRRKNSEGLKNSEKKKALDHREIYKNLPNDVKERMKSKVIMQRKIEEVFCNPSSIPNEDLKRYLMKLGLRENVCENCGISEWQGKQLNLELHHKDGNRNNNCIENLQLLCPNCHSLTKNFRGRNIKKTFVPDEILKENLIKCKNIRRALISSNLSPKGANYIRAKKLLNALVAEQVDAADLGL